jgi:hypothetical protein
VPVTSDVKISWNGATKARPRRRSCSAPAGRRSWPTSATSSPSATPRRQRRQPLPRHLPAHLPREQRRRAGRHRPPGDRARRRPREGPPPLGALRRDQGPVDAAQPRGDRALEPGRLAAREAAAAAGQRYAHLLENIFPSTPTPGTTSPRRTVPLPRARGLGQRRGPLRPLLRPGRPAPDARRVRRPARAGPDGDLERRGLPRLRRHVPQPAALPRLQHAQARGGRHELAIPREFVLRHDTTIMIFEDEPALRRALRRGAEVPRARPRTRASRRRGLAHEGRRSAAYARRFLRTFGFYECWPSSAHDGWHHIGHRGERCLPRDAMPGAATSNRARCTVRDRWGGITTSRLDGMTAYPIPMALRGRLPRRYRRRAGRRRPLDHIDDDGRPARPLVRRPRRFSQGLRPRPRRRRLDARRPSWVGPAYARVAFTPSNRSTTARRGSKESTEGSKSLTRQGQA